MFIKLKEAHTGSLTTRGDGSPGVNLNISRLAGTDIGLNGHAQKLFTSNAHVEHTVVKIWCWLHLLVTRAEGALSCPDDLTLGSSGLVVGALGAGGAAAITTAVVPWYLPSCPKLRHRRDCESRWSP